METKNLLNEQNLPEKGAENVEANSTDKEQNSLNKNSNELSEKQLSVTDDESNEIARKTDVLDKENADDKSNKILQKQKTDKQTEDLNTDDNEPRDINKMSDVDYSKLEKKDLLLSLNELIRHHKLADIKNKVEEIRVNFYKKHKIEVNKAKEEFEKEGGTAEDFSFNDSLEDAFKELYNQYKKKKYDANLLIEEEKKENLQKKYKIIDDIKELINKEEAINKTFQEFKNLQQSWYNVGLVPQKDLKNLWENYHHAVESFYDFVKINKELRDLDLKKNLEEKLKLCEKAEALISEEPVTKAAKLLQEYHNMWREIGPVHREKREEVWKRFKSATDILNKKNQSYFDDLKEEQLKNLKEKIKLCEKVEDILNKKIETPQGWENKSKEIIEIQKLWRSVGFAKKKDDNKVYNRFKKLCDKFFVNKREFYKKSKEIQKNNLKLKIELCEKAETKEYDKDWKKSTEFFIKIQKQWKTIGPVPKRYSESIWKRFSTVCDAFFEAKKEFYSSSDTNKEENLKLKLELIEKIKDFDKTENKEDDVKSLMEFQKQWTEIGYVPLDKKNDVNQKFAENIDKQFEKLKIGKKEREKFNFEKKINNWVTSKSKGKLYSERSKLSASIRELENEIALYENNIGFFSQLGNDTTMLDNINKKIEKAKERMAVLKSKLRILDQTNI